MEEIQLTATRLGTSACINTTNNSKVGYTIPRNLKRPESHIPSDAEKFRTTSGVGEKTVRM